MISTPALAWALSAVPILNKAFAQAAGPAKPDVEWRQYGANIANTKYSPLADIDAANFNKLEIAWRFGSAALGARPEYNWQSTPLVVKGRLYVTAGSRRDVVALDAANGELLWMHRVDEGVRATRAARNLSGHGVSYWTDGTEERILYVTIGYQLVSLDAKTGLPDPNFGDKGIVDLKQNNDQELDLVNADISLHATPAIGKNVVIVGAAHSTGQVPRLRRNAKGYVRGFDVKTGKRLWIFHTIPQPGEFGRDTWLDKDAPENTGNGGVWAQISVDEELDLVYLPVELATGDEVGIYRRGNALFGESLVAVDLHTGKRKWHYQFIHHGVWDHDLPCAPMLCDIPHNGKIVKALAQPSKQAWLYVLNRETGEPLWPIVERKVATDTDVPGEELSKTQPFPSKPPPYDRQGVLPGDLIDWTPELKAQALEIASHYRMGPMFTPAIMSKLDGKWGTLTLPGTQGGTNWPGGCFDVETNIAYVYSKTQLAVGNIIKNPRAVESGFEYVRGYEGAPTGGRPVGDEDGPPPADRGAPAQSTGQLRPGQLTVQGLPLFKPPYGRITAIDLTKGDITWQVAHGATPDVIRNHPALKGVTIPRTGQAGIVGPIVTKTLVICGDPQTHTDETGRKGARLRAYDKTTGEERGALFLPAGQTGGVMTYRLGGVQYLVVAVGGQGYSAELIAFRTLRS